MLEATRRIFARIALWAALALWAFATVAAEPGREAGQNAASPVEAAYSARAGTPLRQFGYDQFGSDGASRSGTGAVQADYALGPGDELLVSLRGQKSFSKRYVIDNAGLLTVDDVRPVVAQALTLAELRAELAGAVASAYPNTDVFVSVTEVRRIGVLVTGAVGKPGRHEIGAFGTLLDALSAAGGVTRSGSLRRIRLFRAGTGDDSRAVDLYELFITGNGAQAGLRLRDGDRLFVPPLGPTLAVMGPVNRPGIYELPPDRNSLTLVEAKELAGGVLRPGAQRALRFAIGPNGEETTEDLGGAPAPVLTDGDLLSLAPLREDRRGEVRLEGHVLRPGPRALATARSLDALLTRADLRPEPYLPFAVLAATDPATHARTLLPVDLAAVLRGRDRRSLSEGDALYVLGADDVDFLTSEPVLELLRGARAPAAESCQGLVVLARALAARPDGPLAKGPQARAAAELTGSRIACPPLFDAVPDLLVFALEHSRLLLGGVPRPGFYPSAGGPDTPSYGGASAGRAVVEGAILESDEPLFELVGHVRRPGVRPLAGGATLRDALAGGGALKRDVYPLLGVIERTDRRTLARALIPFSPQEVAAGRANRRLADGDRVHLFSAARVRALLSPTPADSAPPSMEEPIPPTVAALLGERIVQVRGAVRDPGPYPVAEAATLEALVAAAGGLAATADPGAVEVTAANGTRRRVDLAAAGRLTAGPGDAIRINPAAQAMEARAVTIAGAVRRPGSYDIARGERLSSLIDRAGGLTEEAYPPGTVFLRESERRRERDVYAQKARELEEWMVREVEKGEAARSDVVGLARQLATQLRGVEPLGRIVVEADPMVLRGRPDLDPLLEPDDRIMVPKRTLTVTVTGEVQHPVAAQFVSGKSQDDYLREAGGPTRNADSDRIFLVLPDGRAQPLALSSWNHTVQAIPPGSMLVVPRDPKPFDFLEFSKSIGGILGQLAITAASVSVIAR
ncbi:SLBB domain-containing protein [Azospirillum rugosum]|uniref:Protein involved in polysaccharide export with SLBB domain n=1 Tax=Azospirillum rugosum TaxID=416170 RepID=A0ABS4SZB0_9PROT|nr:SLBB domain-containing protein [Azospirillum rugosum]MBP2296725.1 protein involved in polysaccharide export with SLBB domain [Azospirillum rugosum]MDQ0530462.1 protein involved in polysaccharide export with SLBB domain [Azospirillum rugosum]